MSDKLPDKTSALPDVKTPREILLEAINTGTTRRNNHLAELAKEIPNWIDQRLVPGIRDACAKGLKMFEVGLLSDDRTASRAAACVQWGLTISQDNGKTFAHWDGLLEPAVEKKKGGRPPKEIKTEGSDE